MTGPHSVPRRARSLEELVRLLPQLFTSHSEEWGLAFRPRPTDIIISPYAKSGTTWLQQIAHGLRSGGSMDFEEITDVTPWLELAWDMGWDLSAERIGLLPFHVNASKVTAGDTGAARYQRSEDLVRELTAIWQEQVQTVAGRCCVALLRQRLLR